MHFIWLTINKCHFWFAPQISTLLDALGAVNNYKKQKAKVQHKQQRKEFLNQKTKEEQAKLKRQKEAKKKVYIAAGLKEKKNQKSSLKGTEPY